MFEPCKMEHYIWSFPYGENNYEHLSVCVDYLLIANKGLKSTIDILTNKSSFKLKGTGPISYHLGCDFSRDDGGTLHFAPKNHVKTMVI